MMIEQKLKLLLDEKQVSTCYQAMLDAAPEYKEEGK